VITRWSDNFTKRFYFKARNGSIYGRITIDVGATYDPLRNWIEATIYSNPAGSRVLEYDRTRRIDVPGAVPLRGMD
jgi:hypothetical protein